MSSRGSASYSLKSSSLKSGNGADRSEALPRRAVAPKWEVRLGRLQVAVWLGLAVGACVGGYFVGFFSGRYVGFESARESSSVELPKLLASNSLANTANVNPNGVYDRLKAPAVLPDSGGARASAKVLDVSRDVDVAQREEPIEGNDLKRGLAKVEPHGAALEADSGQTAPQDSPDDDIFGFDESGDRVIFGADEEVEEKVPSSVRMLGGAKGTSAQIRQDAAKQDSAKQDSLASASQKGSASSAAAILDARIANARSEAARVAPPAVEDRGAAKKAADSPVEKPADSSVAVKKVLPSGYFAQVSAPKKLSEAEGVAKRLKRAGFPVVVEAASVNGQSFYRVLVGPEENKVQAERLVGQLESESFVASKPFLRKIK